MNDGKKNQEARVKKHEEIAILQQQIAELTDALQRERADVTNVRRHHDQQITGLKNIVKAQVVRDLLPIIDNFERALKHVPAEGQEQDVKNQAELRLVEWVEGVKKIVAQFEKTLSDIGVQRIKTVGEPFDPRYHEAVSAEEGEGTEEIVSEELQSGYILGDEVIRHAMVRVRT